MTKLSMVIVTWRCRDQIQKCLESLASTNLEDFETIVIDANSKDSTVDYLQGIENGDLAKKLGLRVVLNNRKSHWAENNHRGYLMSRGDFLCFSNPDIVFNRGFDDIVNLQYNNPDSFVSCTLITPDGPQFPFRITLTMVSMFFYFTTLGNLMDRFVCRRWFSRLFQTNLGDNQTVVRVPHPLGSIFLVPRSIIEKYPEGRLWCNTYTWFCADSDMFRVAETMGITCLVDNSHRLIHEGAYSQRKSPSKITGFEVGYGTMEYARRWLNPRLWGVVVFLDAIFTPLWGTLWHKRNPHFGNLRQLVDNYAYRLKGLLYPRRTFEFE